MADDLARRLAQEQRKRLVASLMEYLEQNVYTHLTRGEQRSLRAKVMDAVGSYHDFVLDILKVNRDGMVQNEESLRLIKQVHQAQRRIERSLLED